MIRNYAMIIALLSVSGCAREVSYHGVPAPVWKNLSAEQRQLIVDKAYHDEIEAPEETKE